MAIRWIRDAAPLPDAVNLSYVSRSNHATINILTYHLLLITLRWILGHRLSGHTKDAQKRYVSHRACLC